MFLNRKTLGWGFLIVLLVAGIWLMSSPGNLGQETITRQNAIGALAPFSTNSSGADVVANDGPVSPVVVNLADIPVGVGDGNSQYERWLRGEIDLDEANEGRATAVEAAALRDEAARLAPSSNVQLAESSPGLNAPTLLTSFDSLDINDCCGGGANVPPDPSLAAGPNHLLAAVNVAFEIYDKSGNVLTGPVTFASFFASVPSCNGSFDPTVLYDEAEDRFTLGVDADGVNFCIAVTQTGDPLGLWNIYAIPANLSGAFHDYPHTGIGEDAIYVGANQFGGSLPSGFEGRVWALNKSKMYAGMTLTTADRPTFSTGEDGSPQPLNLHGFLQGTWPSTGSHYFLTDPYDGVSAQIWEWPNALSGGAPVKVATIDLQAATGVSSGYPVDVNQAGNGGSITANDWRMRGFEYRNGHGWTTDSISCNPGSGSVNCVRWSEFDLTTSPPTLVQAGVYSSDGDHRVFPDLAANMCNDMAVGYTKSNGSIFPAVWVTGRENFDPTGALQAEIELKAGEITYTAFDAQPRRWGDYTEMTIDPDGLTFWYLGEYSKNTGNSSGRWGNFVGSFEYASCGGGAQDTVHIGDLDGRTRDFGPNWGAQVRVFVHDNGENPVDGAEVTMDVNGSVRSCTTGAAGNCRIRMKVADSQPDLTFTVTNVSKAGFVYDSGSNHDPDGDSDGTTIIFGQP